MKIIGYRRSDFITKEGRPVTGCRIYLATEIASQNGEGVFVRDMYLSDAKMAELKINLHDLMGREVKIFYNEYRKPENIWCSTKVSKHTVGRVSGLTSKMGLVSFLR